MQRNLYALVFGTAILAAAALAACSGGGGSSPAPPVVSTVPVGSQLTQSGSTFTFTINRSPVAKTHRKGQSARRNAKDRRTPQYVSSGAKGLQIAVTATGVPGVTKYVDISSSSVLCSTNGGFETCTLTIPTIAPTESITVTEVDQTPTNEGSNGYGTGFANGTNILAVGTGTSTSHGGTALTLSLNPVMAYLVDANDFSDCTFETLTPSSTTNAAYDIEGSGPTYQDRIVVTGGVAQTLADFFCFFDADLDENYSGNTPQPLVDVNGSAAPVTFTSNSQHVLVGIYTAGATSPPVPTSQTVSMPDTSQLFDENCIAYDLKLDGNQTQPATLTVSNNLSAVNPFTSGAYTFAQVITIVPLSITATPVPISQSADQPTTVTAFDYQGTGGLTPFASVSNGQGSGAGNCLDSGSTVRATVAQTGPIDTTTWQQTFMIVPVPLPNVTSPVTCTFVLGDVNTGITDLPGYAVTPTITVTVNP